jgi:hypothetical protein
MATGGETDEEGTLSRDRRPCPTRCRLPWVDTRQSSETGQASSLVSVTRGSNASHEDDAEHRHH